MSVDGLVSFAPPSFSFSIEALPDNLFLKHGLTLCLYALWKLRLKAQVLKMRRLGWPWPRSSRDSWRKRCIDAQTFTTGWFYCVVYLNVICPHNSSFAVTGGLKCFCLCPCHQLHSKCFIWSTEMLEWNDKSFITTLFYIIIAPRLLENKKVCVSI